jgi:hypothetical protein
MYKFSRSGRVAGRLIADFEDWNVVDIPPHNALCGGQCTSAVGGKRNLPCGKD